MFKYGVEYKDGYVKITPEALKILERYNWPGNIRELENVIQRAVILSDKTVEVSHLPEHLKYTLQDASDTLQPLKVIEKQYIEKVLRATGNNKTKAAKILQIDRKTIRLKLSD